MPLIKRWRHAEKAFREVQNRQATYLALQAKAMRPIKHGKVSDFLLEHWYFRRQEFWNIFKELGKDVKILEAAPGKGAVADRLLQLEFRDITLLDIEDHRIFDSVKKLPFHLVDLGNDRIPMANKSVDIVLALEMIQHLENPWLFAREVCRVLKDDGKLIVALPIPWNFISRLLFLKKGKFENYGSYHPQHIWAPIKEVFLFCLRDFYLEEGLTFFHPRTKFHIFGRAFDFKFPENENWCMNACYIFKKNNKGISNGKNP